MSLTNDFIILGIDLIIFYAKGETYNDGAIMIDLIDGIALAHKLRELNLGVNIIEQIQKDENWFNEI